jgi:hypothetical protein
LSEKEKVDKELERSGNGHVSLVNSGTSASHVILERRVADLEKENEALKQQIVELKKSLSQSKSS